MLSGEVFIPETITVHLGLPDADAANVTIPYISYIKNVASSEIYPTWPENALRANIYVINTYALNRIYTEWYRSRGYPFDITSSTQYDQAFVYGREIFENISQLTEELIRTYIRRQGSYEPLFSAFCDGVRTSCSGLSQWGTVGLANSGSTPYEILQFYYGEDIDLIRSTEIRAAAPSYPGIPQEKGMVGSDVQTIQIQLNRIAQNFPAIPKIADADGIFDDRTADSVRVFQQVFELVPTGIVNEATWYRLSYIYVSVKQLAELQSEGLQYSELTRSFPTVLREGDYGNAVRAFSIIWLSSGHTTRACSRCRSRATMTLRRLHPCGHSSRPTACRRPALPTNGHGMTSTAPMRAFLPRSRPENASGSIRTRCCARASAAKMSVCFSNISLIYRNLILIFSP